MSLNSHTHPTVDGLGVPASVADLGDGFDTRAVAVQLCLRLRIVEIREDEGTWLTVVEHNPPVRGQSWEAVPETLASARGSTL